MSLRYTGEEADLAVRRIAAEDRERLRRWRDRPEVRSVSMDDSPVDPVRHDAWFDAVLAEEGDDASKLIVTWAGRPVGVIQLEARDPASGTCSWGCHLGEEDVPRGIGGLMPGLALAFGFGRGYRRIGAQVLETNHRMLGILERRGVTREGVLRRAAVRSDGSVVDVVLFGTLLDEWEAVRDAFLARVPAPIRARTEGCLRGLEHP